MTQRLLPKHQAFIKNYLAGMGGKAAAVAAGYAEANARNRAAKLLKHPGVATEIAKAQVLIRKEANYTAERAMSKLDEMVEEARQAGQFSAVMKGLEQKAKLAGLLDEKKGSGGTFKIEIVRRDVDYARVIDHD